VSKQRDQTEREVDGGWPSDAAETSWTNAPTATSSGSEAGRGSSSGSGWEHDRGELRAHLERQAQSLGEQLAASFPQEEEEDEYRELTQTGGFSNEDLAIRLIRMNFGFHPTHGTLKYKLTSRQKNMQRRILIDEDWERVKSVFMRGCQLGYIVMDQEGFLKKSRAEKENKSEADFQSEDDIPKVPGSEVKWLNMGVSQQTHLNAAAN
jgi:hypothetical protein